MRTLVSELSGREGSTVSTLPAGCTACGTSAGSPSSCCGTGAASASSSSSAKPEVTPESVIRVEGVVAANEKAPGGVEVRVAGHGGHLRGRARPALPRQPGPGKDLPGIHPRQPDDLAAQPRDPLDLPRAGNDPALLRRAPAPEGSPRSRPRSSSGPAPRAGRACSRWSTSTRRCTSRSRRRSTSRPSIASGLERVFEIGPAYRAEKHDTPRHINEFVSLDVEMAFIESEQDLMDLETRILAAIFGGMRESNAAGAGRVEGDRPGSRSCARRSPAFPTTRPRRSSRRRPGRRSTRSPPRASAPCATGRRKTAGIEAVFVYAYPRKSRPFYTYPAENNRTKSFDLLFRGLEVTSGSIRINRYEMLLENLEDLRPEAGGPQRLPLHLQVRLSARTAGSPSGWRGSRRSSSASRA